MTKPLSPRMEEVVRLAIGEGKTYPEIADELEISVRTVQKYAQEIGKRMGGMKPQKAMAAYFYREMEEIPT